MNVALTRFGLNLLVVLCVVRQTAHASAFLYTNAPCVYLIASNGISQTATLLGPTGSFSGSLAVPVYVKSSLFNVTSVAPGAFRNCTNMIAFALDSGSKVTTVGAGAFLGCTSLSLVTLRDSVTNLGEAAFLGCAALTNVNLSVATGLGSVESQTFSGCSSLAFLSFPDSVTNLGASAFRDCSSLLSVALPSGVATVSDSAFQGCLKLAAATFSGAKRFGVNAFAGSGLTSVTIPAGLTNIAQGAFADCTNLVSVTYAGSPTFIGSAAFKNCSGLTNLPVPSSLTAVASTAFDGCIGLKAVTLPAGVTDFSDNLFENCTSLVSVACAGVVTNMGEFTFAYCTSLTNVTFLGNAPDAEGSAFDGSYGVFVYYYKGASDWGNLLAKRPTVMLGADGAVEARSFAAWAVQGGLTSVPDLSASALETLFAAESSSVSGVANGAVYAFGSNLTTDDRTSLLQIVFDDGTPIIETPALDSGSANFVTTTVVGTTNLTSGVWDLAIDEVTLPDVTRAGYQPTEVDGVIPAAAFFRAKIRLNE
jgi:hypothetical protein